MTVYYLLDAEVVPDGLKLLLFNQQTDGLEEMLDKDYRPYFFVPHPLSGADRNVIDALGADTKVEEKRELFSDQLVRNFMTFSFRFVTGIIGKNGDICAVPFPLWRHRPRFPLQTLPIFVL